MSEVRVDRLPARDPDTDAELDAFFATAPTSFAQQTPAWRDAIASLGEDEPLYLGARRAGRLVGVLPAWRFAGPLGAILTSAAQAGPSAASRACRAATRSPSTRRCSAPSARSPSTAAAHSRAC